MDTLIETLTNLQMKVASVQQETMKLDSKVCKLSGKVESAKSDLSDFRSTVVDINESLDLAQALDCVSEAKKILGEAASSSMLNLLEAADC